MNKKWFTALEISTFPGTPNNARNIRLKASKENWLKQKCAVGKGFEYHISSLPAETQKHLARKAAEAVAKESPAFLAGKAIAQKHQQDKALDEQHKQRVMQQGAANLMQLTGKARLKAEVKLAIIGAYKQFLHPWIITGSKLKGEHEFANQYNAHQLDFDAESYQVISYIRWDYPRKWIKILENDGAAALGGRYKNTKKCKIESEPKMLEMCQGLIYQEPDIAGAHLHEILVAHSQLNDLHWDVPSISKVRVWLRKFKADHPLLIEKLNNPDDFKNRRQVAFGKADHDICHINQLWELDSTPSDVHLKDGRYSIIGAIDVFSRRAIVILQPTSNSEAVCLLMRKALLEFGVPDAVKTDNGQDYKSKRVVSVLQALGVQQIVVPPFSGDKKPYIERFFGTWSHGISKLLPGYGGHDVATRQKLQARASFADRIMKKSSSDIKIELTSTELQGIIDDWIEGVYSNRTHEGIKTSPFKKWQSQRTTIRTIDNERALDVLLSPVPASSEGGAGVRTVSKDVGISVDGFSYVAPEFGPLIGQKVFCSWNPDNVGEIFVFNSSKLEFICKAQCHELMAVGMTRAEMSYEAKKLQNAHITKQKKELRKARKSITPGDAARSVIAAGLKGNSTITGMPHPKEQATSGLLEQAAIASNLVETKPALTAENFQKLRQEQLEIDRAREIAATAKPRFRNEFEQFTYLLQQKKLRALTNEEIVIMANYRQANPKWAKQAESMVGTSKNATEAGK